MIEVCGLTKIYPPDCRAVDGLDLKVNRGEIFGFLGPNGAGKTTTIKVLSTLSRLNSGNVKIAGFDVMTHPVEVRKSIGYVAQNTGIDYFLTGRENLVLQGHMYRMKKKDITRRIEELASYFEMEKYLDKLVSTYSGGMRRKLDIATALIHEPKLLFLDEPTLGLDIKSRQSLWNYIKKMNSEFNLTILLTTHYLEEADKLCHRVAIINAGKISAIGAPEELKNAIRGDSLMLAFEEVDKKVMGLAYELNNEEFIKDTVWQGNNLHLYVANGGEAVPKVMKKVVSSGVNVKTISLSRPTLDDVFLKHTGTSMLEAKEEKEEEWWKKWAGKGGGNWKGKWGEWEEENGEAGSTAWNYNNGWQEDGAKDGSETPKETAKIADSNSDDVPQTSNKPEKSPDAEASEVKDAETGGNNDKNQDWQKPDEKKNEWSGNWQGNKWTQGQGGQGGNEDWKKWQDKWKGDK